MLEDHLDELRIRFEEVVDLERESDFVDAGCDFMIGLMDLSVEPVSCIWG